MVFPIYTDGDDFVNADGEINHIVIPSSGESSSTNEAVVQINPSIPSDDLVSWLDQWYKDSGQ